jgi:hypothetical protein
VRVRDDRNFEESGFIRFNEFDGGQVETIRAVEASLFKRTGVIRLVLRSTHPSGSHQRIKEVQDLTTDLSTCVINISSSELESVEGNYREGIGLLIAYVLTAGFSPDRIPISLDGRRIIDRFHVDGEIQVSCTNVGRLTVRIEYFDSESKMREVFSEHVRWRLEIDSALRERNASCIVGIGKVGTRSNVASVEISSGEERVKRTRSQGDSDLSRIVGFVEIGTP